MPDLENNENSKGKQRFSFTQLRQVFQNISIKVVKGAFQSFDFVTGVSGWFIGILSGEGYAEFQNGTFRGTFTIGGTLITISDISILQETIDALAAVNGGTVSLVPDEYSLSSNITPASNVTLNGNGSVIDFGGGAFQLLMQGTNAYNTGTIAITHGTDEVVGTGTTFTAGMVGRFILIGDFWYEITAFTDTTHITIASDLIGTAVSGDTFVIADILTNIGIENITFQNSSISLVKGRYLDGMYMDGVSTYTGDIGFDFQDCANVNNELFFVSDCTTWGFKYNNVVFCTINNFAVVEGAGMSLTRVTNTSMGIGSIQAITTVGLQFTNCSNLGFINWYISHTASHAIEFVSGNREVDLVSGLVDNAGADGVKLTATSDGVNLVMIKVKTTTGWQINIANANCDSTILVAVSTDGSGSGRITDSGTGTLKSAAVNVLA